jgi:hypothetical protein
MERRAFAGFHDDVGDKQHDSGAQGDNEKPERKYGQYGESEDDYEYESDFDSQGKFAVDRIDAIIKHEIIVRFMNYRFAFIVSAAAGRFNF